MNGTNATQHRTIPRHTRIIHYDRTLQKIIATNEIETAIAEMKQKPIEEQIEFCAGIYLCYYASQNCMKGLKSCYYP